MKTFSEALEEAANNQENHVFRMEPWKEIAHSDSFKIGAQWAVANLNLLDAKDLLKHEDVEKLFETLILLQEANTRLIKWEHANEPYIKIVKEYQKQLTRVDEALKPFQEGE